MADPKLRATLLATAIIFALRSFGMAVVEDHFQRQVHVLRRSSIVEGWLKQSFEKGRLEGKLEGRLEGEHQARLSLVYRTLQQKFGGIALELQRQLQKWDKARLDQLRLALLEMRMLQESNLWLRKGTAASCTVGSRNW